MKTSFSPLSGLDIHMSEFGPFVMFCLCLLSYILRTLS